MADRILCSNPRFQYLNQKIEIDSAINRVLNSESYILGSEVSEFEKEFANYVGVDFCVGVNSGTDAIILGLRALGISNGDEVITPSHTAVATVAAISATGATPVFVDINPMDFTVDPHEVRSAITRRTKAIIAVHIYGHPCNMDALVQISEENSIHLVEDCAQAHGAKWRNKKVGSFGVLACFSFYPTKNLGAIGDGGALVTDNPEIEKKVRELRQYGWDSHKQSQSRSTVSRLDEIQAAILRVKLLNLDASNSKRREIAYWYKTKLELANLILPTVGSNAEHVFHLFVIQSDERDKIIAKLNEEQIYPGIHYSNPVHLHPAYSREKSRRKSNLIVTEKIRKTILSLPMYPEISESDVDRVCEGVLSV
jgi:dTDP-4-amino-4,6-dideoxygalactose transaminase